MRIIRTALPDARLVELQAFDDPRGSFLEVWNLKRYAEIGIETSFRQVNTSRSGRDVLRGLHFQHPHPQGKLVCVLAGSVFDVGVDVRVGSPTFGRWIGVELSAANRRQLWLPEGFAHGFCVLSDEVLLAYLCTTEFAKEADRAIRFDDAEIAVEWPVSRPRLSEKDANAPTLAEMYRRDLLPHYQPCAS